MLSFSGQHLKPNRSPTKWVRFGSEKQTTPSGKEVSPQGGDLCHKGLFFAVFAPSVRYKIPIYNSGFTGVSPCAYRYFYGNYPIPKKRSKKPSSFAITPCFFSARFPPPKRDMGGSSLSMSVPVVLTAPSRNAISIN